MSRPEPKPLSAYKRTCTIDTRWMDNDIYGHVNNVVYYSFFDTAVNRYLIEQAGLDIHEGGVIGLVVETNCHYFTPLSFPEKVTAGVSVSHIGRSSVRYEIGLFSDTQEKAVAEGYFVHVYVDRASRRPTSLPERFMEALEAIRISS